MIGHVAAGLLVLAQQNVAVLCTSPDPNGGACGAIQNKVESELAGAGLAVKPAHEYAKDWVAPPLARDDKEAKAALDEAVKAFYEGKLDAAKQKLDLAAKLYAGARHPTVADIVKMHLWRATVSLASNEPPANAIGYVNDVLTLDPGHVVDTAVFSSALKDFVDSQKSRTALAEATISIELRTPNAKLRIDDRDLGSSKIPVGTHYLTATAPGHRPMVRTFNTTTDGTSFVIALAPAVDGALARGASGMRDPQDTAALRSFMSEHKLQALVLVASKGPEARVSVLNEKGAESSPARLRSDPLLISSHVIELLKKPTTVARATPVPVRTPRPTRGGNDAKAFAFVVDGGLAVTSWSRTFETSAAGYEKPVAMGGIGPRVVAGIAHESGAFAQVDASWVTYALLSTIETTYSSANPSAKKSAKGGTAIHADASAGYRLTYLQDPFSPGYVGIAVGFAFEDYAAQAVESDAGDPMPMFQSHTRSGPVVRLEAAHPVGPLHLRAGVGGWMASYEETPGGTNGASVSGNGTVPMWLLGAAWRAPDRDLAIGIEYRGQMRSVTYEGASTPVPAIVDAKLDELLHVVSATARFNF